MIQKTIIANYGDPDLGKTTSVILVYKKLKEKGERAVICDPEYSNGDLCAVLTINGVKVGFSSLGDPYSSHREWLNKLIDDEKCPIILTACRYSGVTEEFIESKQPDYRILWTSNARLYEAEKGTSNIPVDIIDRFNDQWATEIANLIESWCYAGK
jgi:Cdc6-like AAA superfamily ATPase